jgi:hypothetical protein
MMLALYAMELVEMTERDGKDIAVFAWLNENTGDMGAFSVTREEWQRIGEPTKLSVEVRPLETQ